MSLQRRLNKLKGNMTLREFSEQVGIGQSTLHNYLKGRDIPSRMLKKICENTGVNADWLLGLTKKKEIDKFLVAERINQALIGITKEVHGAIKQLRGEGDGT